MAVLDLSEQKDWGHEIEHDGYRMCAGMVPQRGSIAARQMTGQRDLPVIAAAAARIKAKVFTIDGEAVVVTP